MDEQNKTTDIGPGKSLLLFQLGPVQDFIAQARSTRDLWSGSYMLSWLMAHAIKDVVVKGNIKNKDVVFPSLNENPLVLALRDSGASVESELALIPNLPNRFLMIVPTEASEKLAKIAREAIVNELNNMGEAVWEWVMGNGGKEKWKDRWTEQIKAFPQTAYAVTPWETNEPWKTAYERVNQLLAARRNTRDFVQWDPVGDASIKDSLSGKEECIGDKDFWDQLRKSNRLFKTQGHTYGAMNLIKRLWMHVEDIHIDSDINYLSSKLNFKNKEIWRELKVESLDEIAEKNTDNKNGYIAVLAMDGDKMGEILSGKNDYEDESYHTLVSEKLSQYALHSVLDIVRKNDGHLIYAGGDDVLALLPADKAILCAEALRKAFKTTGKEHGFEASCGIAIGHFKSPLQMLIKEAHAAEHRAKDTYGRAAIAFTVYKRSGEIIEWGCKWEDGALELMKEITAKSHSKVLSGRFPYALAALLEPYVLGEKLTISESEMLFIIREEVRHVVSRQGRGMPKDDQEKLCKKIDYYLETTKRNLGDFINLFLVETFLNRAKGDN